METRVNAGYTIIRVIVLTNVEIVLGEKINNYGTKYVTWLCYGKDNYCHGHYIQDKKSALIDLYKRAQDEISIMLSILDYN